MLSAYLYLSGSIGVLIGLTIVSLFLGTRSLDSKPRVVLWAGIVGIAGLALFLALDFLTFSPRGLSFRDVIWQEVVALLLQGNRLIHGFGAGSSFTLPLVSGEIAQHPHSIYFATIYQGGLIGLVLVLLLITRCCWLVFARHSPYFNVLGSAWLYAISTLAVDGNTIVSKFDHM